VNKINSYVTKDQQIQQPYTCDTSTTEEFNIAKNQQMQPDMRYRYKYRKIIGKTDNGRNR